MACKIKPVYHIIKNECYYMTDIHQIWYCNYQNIAVLILPLSTKTNIYSLEKDFLTSGLTQKLIEPHFKLPYILQGAQLLPL